MNYRSDKYGTPLSILGFGCLRFQKNGNKIDMAATEAQIMSAISQGVNYFDTAYVYGGSEAALGEILEKNNVRKDIYIATKLPHYLIKSRAGLEKLFQEELRRLRTDYVDYYLMHMLTDLPTWEKLKKLGIEEWIEEKKASGQIRQVGFSYHGGSDMFCQLVDAYDWDFCQIQYNYLDEHSQAGRKGLYHAHAKGIPVIIMEPLRGGKLVTMLPEKGKKIIADHEPHRTPAEWAFRWLWDQPEVTVVLSGMNTMEMVDENIAAASTASVGELTDADQAMLRRVVDAIQETMKVGCTACGYCQPCPKNVDIPGVFACYNRVYSESKSAAVKEYMKCTAFRKDSTAASQCIGCGKCEQHCPQGIEIRKHLKDAANVLETPVYKIMRKGIEIIKAF